MSDYELMCARNGCELKRNLLVIHTTTTWMNLRGIILSKSSQSLKVIYYTISFTFYSGKGKSLVPLCFMLSTATAHGPKKHYSMQWLQSIHLDKITGALALHPFTSPQKLRMASLCLFKNTLEYALRGD